MTILYTILIHLYSIAIRIAGLFSAKAQQWVAGREGLYDRLRSAISSKPNWIWFHAASLGEFEQGRPLIEHIRERHPEYGILLTFFSPSGYLIRKSYQGVDHVTYMPLDTPDNAKKFIDIVKPAMVVFIKYEIWYHHLTALETVGVPTFLISANLRANQVYFKPIGRFIEKRLRNLQHIFTQTEECAAMLAEKGFTNVSHAGDTRVDRVLAIVEAPKDFLWLKNRFVNKSILVAGSTWPADEERLIPALLKRDLSCIIAPHEVSADRITSIQKQLPGSIRLSQMQENTGNVSYIIVDTIGDLAHLYALGSLAYVGGGFGSGIHNILEPAAHGIPVIFGPRYQKFIEAVSLIQSGAAMSIDSSEDIEKAIHYFLLPERWDAVRNAIAKYMQVQRGATGRIYGYLKECL